MATPNIVPRAAGEGGLGTAAKGWGGTFITNTTTSSATEGGKLVLAADDGAVMASGHRLGAIEFSGAEDTSSTLTIGAKIESLCDATWSASENGADLVFSTTDGNASTSESMRIFSDLTSGVRIHNTTTSSATEGGKLRLSADDGAVMADNHRLGVIEFAGAEDTGSTLSIGARIEAICRDAWDGSNNDADLQFYTTDGTTESLVLTLDADKKATFAGDLACSGDTVTFSSDQINDPAFVFVSTSNDAQTARFQLKKNRNGNGSAGQAGDNIGEVEFWGYDADGTPNEQQYGKILVETDVVTEGQESGKMSLGVANHDGGNGYGLILTGGSANDEIDLTLGLGSDSLATFPGAIKVDGPTGISIIDTTTSSATEGGNLILAADDGAVQGSGHRLGVIEFKGAEDTGNTLTVGARIESITKAAWDASNNDAKLSFYTSYDNAQQSEKVDIGGKTAMSVYNDYDTITFENQLADNEGGGDILRYGSGQAGAIGTLHFLHTDGSWDVCDANAVATGGSQLLGIPMGTDPGVHGMLLKGYYKVASGSVDGTAAIGAPVYVADDSTGEFDFTAPNGSGDYVRIVGYCIDIDSSDILLYFNPDNTFVEIT